ncbi:transposase [Methylobacterium sp. P5_C11]
MQILSRRTVGGAEAVIDEHRTPGGVRSENERGLVEAALYQLRTGCHWRAVPAEIASWQRAAELFPRWSRNGTWARIFLDLRDRGEPLLDAVMLDGTVDCLSDRP